jgi:hypothetical protein
MSKKRSSRRPSRTTARPVSPAAKHSWRGSSAVILGAIAVAVAGLAVVGFLFLQDDDGAPTPTAPAEVAASSTEMPPAIQAVVPEAAGPPLTVLPTGSTFVVGPQRFGIGLVDERDLPVQIGRLELVFLKLAGTQGTVTQVLPAPFLDYGLAEGHDHTTSQAGDPTPTGPGLGAITGVFVARPTFDAPAPTA